MAAFIYVLELQGNKYYVGKTHSLAKRIGEHFMGKGAHWTRTFPPVRVVKSFEEKGPLDEHMVTLDMMYKHGMENVRGAEFCNPELSEVQRASIQAALYNSRNQCFRCGSSDHWSKDCDVVDDELGSASTLLKDDEAIVCKVFNHVQRSKGYTTRTVVHLTNKGDFIAQRYDDQGSTHFKSPARIKGLGVSLAPDVLERASRHTWTSTHPCKLVKELQMLVSLY